MLFYRKGVALAKLTHDDDCSLHPLSASSECDSHHFLYFSLLYCHVILCLINYNMPILRYQCLWCQSWICLFSYNGSGLVWYFCSKTSHWAGSENQQARPLWIFHACAWVGFVLLHLINGLTDDLELFLLKLTNWTADLVRQGSAVLEIVFACFWRSVATLSSSKYWK